MNKEELLIFLNRMFRKDSFTVNEYSKSDYVFNKVTIIDSKRNVTFFPGIQINRVDYIYSVVFDGIWSIWSTSTISNSVSNNIFENGNILKFLCIDNESDFKYFQLVKNEHTDDSLFDILSLDEVNKLVYNYFDLLIDSVSSEDSLSLNLKLTVLENIESFVEDYEKI